MQTYKRVPLRMESHKRIYYNQLFLQKYIRRIEEFLKESPYMNTIEFAKEALEYKELKANNNIEGITDDFDEIENTIRNENNIPWNKKERIINLYRGYNYILNNKDINKDSLKELYGILSNDLLNELAIDNMGDYYRKRPVYIVKDSMLDIIKTINENEVEIYMDKLFNFIDNYEANTDIENFIKSQIIHFYIIYIHPYFDVNGRTARTVSMWYLLNNEAYPYVIFNRAISHSKSKYNGRLNHTRKRGDITLFLKYMLKEVLKEFEKEKIINNIKENADEIITMQEMQLLDYLLTLNGGITIRELCYKYNAYNIYKTPEVLANNYIFPLINKGVLINLGQTDLKIDKDMPNIRLAINENLIGIDTKKIKSLKINKYISKQL